MPNSRTSTSKECNEYKVQKWVMRERQAGSHPEGNEATNQKQKVKPLRKPLGQQRLQTSWWNYNGYRGCYEHVQVLGNLRKEVFFFFCLVVFFI